MFKMLVKKEGVEYDTERMIETYVKIILSTGESLY
jgi:hypothetical protein